MRIYISDGKVFAELNETVELGKINIFSTISGYKKNLMEHFSDLFDTIVRNAALKGLLESEESEDNSGSVAVKQETIIKTSKESPETQETETDQPQELFRAPRDEPKQPETKKTRRRIDYGKIMALHNAKWSNQKIADEMGMSYNAVATAISTYKKKTKEGGARRRWKRSS